MPVLDAAEWRLSVSGLVREPLELSLAGLRKMPADTFVATLECAGNGRALFSPAPAGDQWRLGAVSTAEWTGVRLDEVLDRAGIQAGASELVFRGADRGTWTARPSPSGSSEAWPWTTPGNPGRYSPTR